MVKQPTSDQQDGINVGTQDRIPLSPKVVEQIKVLNQAINHAVQARILYIQGLMDGLGLEGEMHIDLDTFTYSLTGPEE